jgi:hypothetical protein
MAIHEILATLQGRLADPTTGIATKVPALVSGLGLPAGRVATDFAYEAWMLVGRMQNATRSIFAFRARAYTAEQRVFIGNSRKAAARIDVAFECFAADPAQLQDTVAVVAQALLQTLDDLEPWSRTHAGTIALLQDPIEFQFGDFAGLEGTPTSSGFIATLTLQEESPL